MFNAKKLIMMGVSALVGAAFAVLAYSRDIPLEWGIITGVLIGAYALHSLKRALPEGYQVTGEVHYAVAAVLSLLTFNAIYTLPPSEGAYIAMSIAFVIGIRVFEYWIDMNREKKISNEPVKEEE